MLSRLPGQKQKALLDVLPAARQLSLSGYALLEAALSHTFRVPPPLSALHYDAAGKPSFPNIGLHISLSHAGGRAVCALSDQPVGLDLEPFAPMPAWRGLAREMRLDAQSEKQFLPLWALWESWLKYFGRFQLPGDGFRAVPVAGGFALFDGLTPLPAFGLMPGWIAGFHLAICVPNRPVLPPTFYDWRF